MFYVKRIGNSNSAFTNNNVYKATGIDKDGDYYVVDDWFNETLEYKGGFEKISEEEYLKYRK